MGTTSFQEVNRLEHGNNKPTPTSTEVKEKVQLYPCPPLGHQSMLQGVLYLLPFTNIHSIKGMLVTDFDSIKVLSCYELKV